MSQVKHHIAGQQYWRSLEQLGQSEEVRKLIEAEFPGYDPEHVASFSRRRFMKLMGAGLALAGVTLAGCRRWPTEKLAPYAAPPKDRVPGIPEQYATMMELSGVATGLLVSSFDGRPIKVEGNPSHPYSLGASDAWMQASVLEMYDLDRSRVVIDRTTGEARESTWEAFATFATKHFGDLRAAAGEGLAILCESTSSPSVADMRRRLMAAFPKATWCEYEPVNRDNEVAGTKAAFGQALRPIVDLDKARVIALFDEDLLGMHPAHLRYARQWAAGRKSADRGVMNRMYVAESRFSTSGAVADRRLPICPSRIVPLLAALGARVSSPAPAPKLTPPADLTPAESAFIDALVADLAKHAGASVVLAGPDQPPAAHILGHAINQAIGAFGNPVTWVAPPGNPDSVPIAALAADMAAGRVKTLLILGGNPAYDAPADLDFAKALATVPISIHLSLYHNETSAACRFHLPRAHWLESWGDGRAWDGTIGLAQPLIRPLFDGKSIAEVLAIVTGDGVGEGYDITRRALAPVLGGSDFEKRWRMVLHEGIVPESAHPIVDNPRIKADALSSLPVPATPTGGFEIRFAPAPSVYDGRFANNGWLQEMPDPLTKLTWDNAAIVSKVDADKLGAANGDVLKIDAVGRSVELPCFILPGQPQGVVTLPLGYGRTAAGNVGNGVGFNVYSMRTGSPAIARVTKTGRSYDLAMAQDHHIIDQIGIEARAQRAGAKGQSGTIIREASLGEYQADPKFAKRQDNGKISLQLFEPPAKFADPHAWAMAIDMNSCTGCSACVVACQAENNIPIVGKEEVLRNREMQWIRVDRYFKGNADDPAPDVVYQPMACQHCENAPCEQVCPVGATMHDTEGLNVMVYNRCIGTRYCSNNCPYKVRRFNYFDWHSKDPRGSAKPWLGIPDAQQKQQVDQIKQLLFNPDVSVRMRGVMEKCTYCVQRIHARKIDAANKGQTLKDGDIVTACQQACPTQAIVFGDLNDPTSKVRQLHEHDLAYGVLQELNTRPRTKYLAKLRNPEEGA